MKCGVSATSLNASRSRFNSIVDTVVEIDEGVGGPYPLLQLLTGYQLSGLFQEDLKDSEGLFLQADFCPITTQFSRVLVQFELSEPNGRG
jgi:hypothetical protein